MGQPAEFDAAREIHVFTRKDDSGTRGALTAGKSSFGIALELL